MLIPKFLLWAARAYFTPIMITSCLHRLDIIAWSVHALDASIQWWQALTPRKRRKERPSTLCFERSGNFSPLILAPQHKLTSPSFFVFSADGCPKQSIYLGSPFGTTNHPYERNSFSFWKKLATLPHYIWLYDPYTLNLLPLLDIISFSFIRDKIQSLSAPTQGR